MLNQNQTAAVFTQSKRVFVLSGAGTGKTTVIFNRIKYLLENNVDPCSILFISFTTRTISDIKNKFNKSVDNPVIKTFHGLAFSIVYTNNSKQLVNTKSDMFYNFDEPTLNELVLQKQEYRNMNVITKPKTDYQRILDENNLFDYVDLEIDFLTYLRDKHHQSIIQNQYKYVFIDEAQDLSKIQVDILSLMINEHTHVFFVGDPDQSIYAFRGSIANQVQIIIKKFECKVYTLVDCYRCSYDIIRLANNLISNNNKRTKKQLISHKNESGVIEYHQFSNTKKEADFVFQKIRDFTHQKFTQNQIVILVRNHSMANEIKALLFKSYSADISCMSIHQAKGLEFEIVFVMGIDDFKSKTRTELEEERRLMFVAITRAKSYLIMTSPFLNHTPRFIKEMKVIVTKHEDELSNLI